MDISKILIWQLAIIVPTVISLYWRRTFSLRIICVVFLLFWGWSILFFGVRASVRNAIDQVDSAKGSMYIEGWRDGGIATQDLANSYIGTIMLLFACLSVLGVIPVRSKTIKGSQSSSLGNPTPYHNRIPMTNGAGRERKSRELTVDVNQKHEG